MVRNLICTAAILVGGNAGLADELTLDEAIRLGLKTNRTIQNATLEIEKLEDHRAGLKTELWPSANVFALLAQPLLPFNFVVPQGALGTDSGGRPLPASDASIHNTARPIGVIGTSLIQPLSSIPSIKRGLQIADIGKGIAEEQLRLERQTVVRDIRQLYYDIQSAESSLRAAQEGLRLSQEVVRVTAEYAAKRQVLDVEYLEAQMRLARFTENALDFENRRETLKVRLNHRIGRDVLTNFTLPPMSEISDVAMPDLSDARSRAEEQRPEVRQARLKVERAKLEMRNAAASFNPTVAAQYIGVELLDATPLLPRQIGVVGASVTWDPFTWGRRRHTIAEHRYEIEEAENSRKEMESQVTVEVTEQFRKVKLAEARLRVASLSRQMAVESLRVAQKQYEAQYSLVKSVLEAQAGLESANSDYQRTLGDLWTARAEFSRVFGEDQ